MDEYSIYNVDFGVGKGHEQSYPRPAIIFKSINELKMCLAIPLTSNLSHLGLPYTAQINKTASTKLRENSVALVFQLRIIDNERITGSGIGKLEDYQINKIKAIIKDMLNL
jgi:mRNA-degrading endonuclease toxin of MazEF toxin-antitoxin module